MSNVLLCISGNSPMVVPEAHLVNEEKYHQVYVVTSQSPSCPAQQIEDFFSTRESVQLFFHRVEGFNNLEKDEEHQNFSEALLRVYLEAREASTDGCLDVCLTGGFKTMVLPSNGQPDCLEQIPIPCSV